LTERYLISATTQRDGFYEKHLPHNKTARCVFIEF